jgi:hypothetical protein
MRAKVLPYSPAFSARPPQSGRATLELSAFALGDVDHKGNPFVWLPLEKRASDQDRHAAAVFAKVLFLTRWESSNRL